MPGDKAQRARQEAFFASLLVRFPSNRNCADCGQLGTKWASSNIGVFLCIQCAGMHRKLGTHISKIKSIALDDWTEEQMQCMQEAGGNEAVNKRYNTLPEVHRFPVSSGYSAQEAFIKEKYEKRSFSSAGQSTAINSNGTVTVRNPKVHPAYAAELKTLKEMGFAVSEGVCKAILLKNSGDLRRSIEELLAIEQKPASPTATAKEAALLVQLRAMGFGDDRQNLETLRRRGGKLGETVEELVTARSPVELKSEPPTKAAVDHFPAKKASLFQPPKPSTEDILSLFDTLSPDESNQEASIELAQIFHPKQAEEAPPPPIISDKEVLLVENDSSPEPKPQPQQNILSDPLDIRRLYLGNPAPNPWA